MSKIDIIFGIIEVVGAIIAYKITGSVGILHLISLLGGYHLGKGLYGKE